MYAPENLRLIICFCFVLKEYFALVTFIKFIGEADFKCFQLRIKIENNLYS